MKEALVKADSWRFSGSVWLTPSCALHLDSSLFKIHKVFLYLSTRYLCGKPSKASLPENYNSNTCVFKYIQCMKEFSAPLCPASRPLDAQILQ